MLQSALNKEAESKAYQLYLSVRPNMTEETYQTFEEFYQPQKVTKAPESKKSAEEILLDVKEIMNSHSWR